MDLKTFHFFSCFEIGNWVCHILFLLHETYCERNNYSSLLWYVGPSIWTQFKKKVKVTKSQAHSIMSLLENIDWNQLVSIIFKASSAQARLLVITFLLSVISRNLVFFVPFCLESYPVLWVELKFWKEFHNGAFY